MGHDGSLQIPVEAFYDSVGCRMISGCPRKRNAAELGQGVEELQLELMCQVLVFISARNRVAYLYTRALGLSN
jgi:hypothetical protein